MQLTSDKTLYYNAKDAAATRVIARELIPNLEKLGVLDPYRQTVDLFDPLMYMMIRGVRVDHDKLQEMKKKCEFAIIDYREKLNKLCGRQINPNSSLDCQRYFYVERGITPYTKRNTKGTSSITCDDKALQRLARGTSSRKGFDEARIIQRIRQLEKLKGTYLEIQFDKDSRLRCSYNPRGTRFSRLSSSKTIFGTGMNMQNLPPAFQRFLVVDDGCIFLSIDKRQAEWVVVAYASGDASMIKAVEDGLDTHSYTASNMFKVPMEIIKREHKILGTESSPDIIEQKRREMDFLQPYLQAKIWIPLSMTMRQCGKKSNHGLNYDEQARMFSLINGITEKEAEVIINFYHRIYPGIKAWYESIKNKLAKDRTLEDLYGRKYNFLDKWGPDLFKSAYSFIPQSTVGELVNRGMKAIYRDNHPDISNLEMLMQVHDSIDFQMPLCEPDKIVRCVRRLAEHLNPQLRVGGREFYIKSDLKIGYNLGELEEMPLDASDTELESKIGEFISGKKAA